MTNELKPCPFCGSSPLVLPGHTGDLARCSNVGCAARGIVPIEVWNTRPIEDELRAEIAHLTGYCNRLAEGYPDGMLPTDVQVFKDANATFAQQLFDAQAEIERLKAAIAEYWETGNTEALQEIGCGR